MARNWKDVPTLSVTENGFRLGHRSHANSTSFMAFSYQDLGLHLSDALGRSWKLNQAVAIE